MSKTSSFSSFTAVLFLLTSLWFGERIWAEGTWTNFKLKGRYRYITAIAIDRADNIWFGERLHDVLLYRERPGPVDRFDGEEWTRYPDAQSAIQTEYPAIATTINRNGLWTVDGHGNVWTANVEKGVGRYDGKSWNIFTQAEGLVDDRVSGITADSKGNVWFGTLGGVSKFDGREWTTFRGTHYDPALRRVEKGNSDLAGDVVTSIGVDSRDNVWIGTADLHGVTYKLSAPIGGVSRFDGRGWTIFAGGRRGSPSGVFVDNPPPGNSVVTLTVGPDDRIWVALDAWSGGNGDLSFHVSIGVGVFDGEEWTVYTPEDGLPSGDVQAIVIDKKGNVWFGTHKGVSTFDGKEWITYTTADGLVDNRVEAIAIDLEGNKWFGTLDGVSRFREDVPTGVPPEAEDPPETSEGFMLYQNYPDPFNTRTTIGFALAHRSVVKIHVYNVFGQVVKTLLDRGEMDRGYHSIVWDGCDEQGQAVANGVYLCRLIAGDFTAARKMLLIR